ncbi:MAG: hypothetical protein ACKVQJ_15375 [Pyrinomonadaceae bacterium]
MNSVFKDLLEAFKNAGVRFLVVGGYAVIKHTEPRFTKDLDVWAAADHENAEKVYAALKEFGAPLGGLSPDDFTKEDSFFTMGMPPNRIDVLFGLDGVDTDSIWENRVTGRFGTVEVNFICRADLIKNKEAVGRLQDLADAEKLRETE